MEFPTGWANSQAPNQAPNQGPQYGPLRAKKTFVLCFDGTGNKFSNTDGDSNILKIFRMLDASDPTQLHYYQPGIGTYVESKSLSHTTWPARLNSWFQKARDSAIGSSFDEHVMGGYKFLMRYYSAGDDIYFFGFSRGAYVARFLAEMLDYVGLLGAGMEEMARFAWKAFAQWQQRKPEDHEKKKIMADFLTGFRETFSRPIRRIKFLGLFDTVNSVPRFENAWMQRSKFPYTARSSALIIRHAVGIDERRAKFRQDLISETKAILQNHELHGHHWRKKSKPSGEMHEKREEQDETPRYRRASQAHLRAPHQSQRSISPARSLGVISDHDNRSTKTGDSQISLRLPQRSFEDDDEAYDAAPQDIVEVWFPGCHADIGGGWEMPPGEVPLSFAPLVWMVREARKAGLQFDYEQMVKMNCIDPSGDDLLPDLEPYHSSSQPIPQFKVTVASPLANGAGSPDWFPPTPSRTEKEPAQSKLYHTLEVAATRGRIHDCLCFNNGLPASSVISWKIMEWLPFRRMDLQADGSWSSISWPLPRGEVRDIPEGAWVHTSALKRMKANPEYRPGNLIVRGGGRGVRRAPPYLGMGEWDVLKEEGDPVGEVWILRKKGDGVVENGQNGVH